MQEKYKEIKTKKNSKKIISKQFISDCDDLKYEISKQTEIAFICALKTSTLILENLKKQINFA